MDPRERAAFLAEPLPDIVIACGRATVPYIRALKKAGGRRLFAVFLQDPRASRGLMDLIWTPAHDKLRGPNVLTTLTSPHPFSRRRLLEARAAPDPRLRCLPRPRCAIVLGGPSGAQHFTLGDMARIRDGARAIASQGYSLMATPSRRTPAELTEAVREGAKGAPGFIWDGTGENPYAPILALAEAILVTGDSANMVGEAVATGRAGLHFRAQRRRVAKTYRNDRGVDFDRRGAPFRRPHRAVRLHADRFQRRHSRGNCPPL